VILCDVNVLVHAFHENAPDHEHYAQWLGETVTSEQAYGVSELVLSGFLRIVTNRRIMRTPAPIEDALSFTEALRSEPNAITLAPGPRHWTIFTNLCRQARATGNLIPDAYLAALAIEHGAEFVTTDRDFARFPDLRWRHPLPQPTG
jgi:toxin-antitoxin system PIN domain toxin